MKALIGVLLLVGLIFCPNIDITLQQDDIKANSTPVTISEPVSFISDRKPLPSPRLPVQYKRMDPTKPLPYGDAGECLPGQNDCTIGMPEGPVFTAQLRRGPLPDGATECLPQPGDATSLDGYGPSQSYPMTYGGCSGNCCGNCGCGCR